MCRLTNVLCVSGLVCVCACVTRVKCAEASGLVCAMCAPPELRLEHTAPLKSMACAEVFRLFDTSPLMVGCWSCLADTIEGQYKKTDPKRHQAALKAVLSAGDDALWPAVDRYHRDLADKGRPADDIFPPGPAIIWQESAV